jgi:hypothetical protein
MDETFPWTEIFRDHHNGNSAIRKGQFLGWSRGLKKIVETLKRRISEGYYNSKEYIREVAD